MLLCANGYRFADRDMFARFAGIGIGHDAVLLGGHAHGLAIDSPHADADDDEDNEVPGLWRASLEDTGEDEDMDEDEISQDGIDSDGSASYASDDSSSYICF